MHQPSRTTPRASPAELLLYGIVFEGGGRTRLPPGVGRGPVQLIEADGLGAAVSAIAASDTVPTVARALAYARVVEALHADRTVMPLRFGCVLGAQDEVRELLHARGEEFARVLGTLDGCVEMGVRAYRAAQIPPFEKGGPGGICSVDCIPVVQEIPPAPLRKGRTTLGDGTVYLMRRKAVYTEADQLVDDVAIVAERMRSAFAGRFVQFRVDMPSRVSPVPAVLSAYFLVQREALASFREAFREFTCKEPAPVLLTGPWPPYNFVLPESARIHGRQPR